MAVRKIPVINDGQVPLPSFSFPGMPLGFIVSDTTGQNWQLTTSSATVDHTTVETCAGNPQLRWLNYTGGTGGIGTVTSVAATAGGLLAVAGTPTVAPTVGLAAAAANTILGNNTGVSAVPVAMTVAQLQAMGVGFAADTIVQLNNTVPAAVNAWESVVALTTSTPGAEVSSWTVKLLTAGAQGNALVVTGSGTQVPTGSAGAPSMAFQGATSTGFYRDAANSSVSWSIGGSLGGLLQGTGIWIFSGTGSVMCGAAHDTGFSRGGAGLTLSTFSTGDIIASVNPAVAGTTGFLGVPHAAGTAGTPANAASATMMYVDTTNNLVKFYYGGAWKSAALT